MESRGLDVNLESTLEYVTDKVDEAVSKWKARVAPPAPRDLAGGTNDSSDLVGVSPWSGNFQARFSRDGKTLYLGCYKLRADAALAYDVALRTLTGIEGNARASNGGKSIANFASREAHRRARAMELRQRLSTTGTVGIVRGVESLEESLARIETKVNHAVSKWMGDVELVAGDFLSVANDDVDDGCSTDDDKSSWSVTEGAMWALESFAEKLVSTVIVSF